MSAFDAAGLARLDAVTAGHVASGEVPGATYVVARAGEVHVGAVGTSLPDGAGQAIAPDTIFRISSMTKPVTAAAAMALVEDCVLRLDDPVDGLLPELADRRVLARPGAALDDTVAADRPISLRDLLTFRLGLGMDFSFAVPQPSLAAMADAGLGIGPPAPQGPPPPDEWMRVLGRLPLEYQPGDRWLYHVGADVLGVLVARAAGQPLEVALRERLFGPLGMVDTGFHVPAASLDRFGPCFGADLDTGARTTYDEADGQWASSPAFPGGGAGLVSTASDYLAFATMLRHHGRHDGRQVLSRASVELMTTNHLTPEQLAVSAPDPSRALGWGFGMGVQVRRTGLARSVGSYGWDGGLGSSWANDPSEGLTGILLTNQTWTSPQPPAICADFWTCAYAALDG